MFWGTARCQSITITTVAEATELAATGEATTEATTEATREAAVTAKAAAGIATTTTAALAEAATGCPCWDGKPTSVLYA